MLFKNRAESDGRASHHPNEERCMIKAKIIGSVYRQHEERLWRAEDSGLILDGKFGDSYNVNLSNGSNLHTRLFQKRIELER